MLLGIAPRFDEATSVSYKWFRHLVSELQDQKWVTLEEEDAVRSRVVEAFNQHHPEIIVFYDHGVEDGLVEQGGKGYVIDLKNVDKFAGRVIYTMACLSAKKLGKQHWRNGGVYWGYTEVFGFTLQEEELFRECANAGLIYRINEGKSWDECVEYAKRKFDEAIDKAELVWTKIWLQHDRDSLVCYTPSSEPEPDCRVRRMALRLFGRSGWQIRWAHIFFLIGYGVALHDFAHQTWELKGTPLSTEGGYVGFGIMFFSLLYLSFIGRFKLRKRRGG